MDNNRGEVVMIVKEIKTNDYVSISKLPTSDFVINPYIGCPHACKYCYARFMKRFTNHQEEWGEFIDVKLCDKKLNTKKLIGKNIFLSSVTDCYNPLEEKYKITRSILKQLIGIECNLTISTKSNLIIRDIDILKQLNHVEVALSMNTLDEKFKNDMDNASSIKDRIETLKILHEHGIKTVLFMSPIFPGATDFRSIIHTTKKYVDTYWLENLNLRGDYKITIMDYIQKNCPEYYPLYDEIYHKKNNTYWETLSKEIDAFCEKENVKYINYFYHEKIRKQ